MLPGMMSMQSEVYASRTQPAPSNNRTIAGPQVRMKASDSATQAAQPPAVTYFERPQAFPRRHCIDHHTYA